MRLKAPETPVLVLLLAIVVFAIIVAAALAGAGAFGMVPLVPVAGMGTYVIWSWIRGFRTLKRERRSHQDFNAELAAMIEEYRRRN